MSTGCLDCDKKQAETGRDTDLCDSCELAYLDWCVTRAMSDYENKRAEIEKKKEKQNAERR